MRTRVFTAFICFVVYILSTAGFAATWEQSARIAGSVTQLKASPQWYHGIVALLDESTFPFAAVGNQVIGAGFEHGQGRGCCRENGKDQRHIPGVTEDASEIIGEQLVTLADTSPSATALQQLTFFLLLLLVHRDGF